MFSFFSKNISINDNESKTISPQNTYTVFMNEIAITTSAAKQYYLGTGNATTCIIVAAYNPITQTAALAHLDELTNIPQTIEKIYRALNTYSSQKIKIYLASETDCVEDFEEVHNLIKYYSNLESDNKFHRSRSLVIDSNDGSIKLNIPSKQFYNGYTVLGNCNRLLNVLWNKCKKTCAHIVFDSRETSAKHKLRI